MSTRSFWCFCLDTAAFISSFFYINEKVLCMIMRIMYNQHSPEALENCYLSSWRAHVAQTATVCEREEARGKRKPQMHKFPNQNWTLSFTADDIIAVPCSRGTSLRNPPLYSTWNSFSWNPGTHSAFSSFSCAPVHTTWNGKKDFLLITEYNFNIFKVMNHPGSWSLCSCNSSLLM